VSRQLKVLNDGGWQDVILSVSEGSAPMVRKTIRRHPERMWRICARGEEAGKTSSG